jgi:hypothetical protein
MIFSPTPYRLPEKEKRKYNISVKNGVLFIDLRLSQNFSFWESNLRFGGKSGPLSGFSKVSPKTNRVLGETHFLYLYRQKRT